MGARLACGSTMRRISFFEEVLRRAVRQPDFWLKMLGGLLSLFQYEFLRFGFFSDWHLASEGAPSSFRHGLIGVVSFQMARICRGLAVLLVTPSTLAFLLAAFSA